LILKNKISIEGIEKSSQFGIENFGNSSVSGVFSREFEQPLKIIKASTIKVNLSIFLASLNLAGSLS
jgi:hypothetical protein